MASLTSFSGIWIKVLNIPAILAGVTLFLLMLMTFFDVVLRSLFNAPFAFGTEMTQIFMAIIVFAALPSLTWNGKHIVVDLLDSFTIGMIERVRDVAINLASGLGLLWPAYRAFELAARARDYGDVTEFLHIPQFYIQYLIATSVMITAVILLVRAALFAFARHLLPDNAGDGTRS